MNEKMLDKNDLKFFFVSEWRVRTPKTYTFIPLGMPCNTCENIIPGTTHPHTHKHKQSSNMK